MFSSSEVGNWVSGESPGLRGHRDIVRMVRATRSKVDRPWLLHIVIRNLKEEDNYGTCGSRPVQGWGRGLMQWMMTSWTDVFGHKSRHAMILKKSTPSCLPHPFAVWRGFWTSLVPWDIALWICLGSTSGLKKDWGKDLGGCTKELE